MAARDPFGEQRAQLLEGAARLPWAAIWQRLAAGRAALIETTLDVTEAQAVWRPPQSAEPSADEEADWCIAEVMRHLITATPNIAAIIEATAHGRAEPKDPPGAISVADAGIDELRARLVAASEHLLSVGLRMPAQPNDEVTVEHAFFGPLPCRAWPLFQAVHDGMHTAQINALKGAAGYPAADAR